MADAAVRTGTSAVTRIAHDEPRGSDWQTNMDAARATTMRTLRRSRNSKQAPSLN